MLVTLAVLLLIAWMLGVFGTYAMGSYLNVLLVVAIILILLRFVLGRPRVT